MSGYDRMNESEGYVRWRDTMLSQATTTPGVPIDFVGNLCQVCITDDGRKIILLPHVMAEPVAA